MLNQTEPALEAVPLLDEPGIGEGGPARFRSDAAFNYLVARSKCSCARHPPWERLANHPVGEAFSEKSTERCAC